MTERVIRVTLEPATAPGATRVRSDLESIDRTAKKTQSSVDFLKKSLNQLAVGVSIAATIATLTRYADTFTNIQNKLRLVTTSTENLDKVQADLFRTAQATRTEYEATVNLYSRVARNADQLGLSQRQVLELTTSVSQAIQISGTNAVEASAGIIQFSQALASGVLRGDELRSVLENMPRLARAIADGLGVTIGELRRLGGEGKLTADAIVKAIRSQAPGIATEFGKINVTIGASFTKLQNQIVEGFGRFAKDSGLTAGISNAIQGLAANIGTLTKVLVIAGGAWATFNVAMLGGRIAERVAAFLQLFRAVQSGNAVLLGSVAAERARATAALATAQAELQTAAATAVSTRATIAQIAAERALQIERFKNIRFPLGRRAAVGRFAELGTTSAALGKNLARDQAALATAQATVAASQARVAATAGASTGAMNLLKGAVSGVLTPFRGLATLIAANPIAAIVTGVVTATAVLINFSDEIKVSSDGMITLRDIGVATFQILAEKAKPLTDTIAAGFAAITDSAISLFDVIAKKGAPAFETLGLAIRQSLPGQLFTALQKTVEPFFDEVEQRARELARRRRVAEGVRGDPSARGGAGSGPVLPPDPGLLKLIENLKEQAGALDAQRKAGVTAADALVRYNAAVEIAKAGNKSLAGAVNQAAENFIRARREFAVSEISRELAQQAEGLELQARAGPSAAAALQRFELSTKLAKVGVNQLSGELEGLLGRLEKAQAANAIAGIAQDLQQQAEAFRRQAAAGPEAEAALSRFELETALAAVGVKGLTADLEALFAALQKSRGDFETGKIVQDLQRQAEELRIQARLGPLAGEALAEYAQKTQLAALGIKSLTPEIAAANAELRRAGDLAYIATLQEELRLVRLTNEERAKEEALRKLSSEATAAQRREVEKLAVAIEKERESQKILEEFARSTAEGVHQAFADFLFNPFEEGLKGMLRSLVSTLHRIAAEMLANQILKQIFGFLQNTGNPFLAAIGTAGSAIAGRAAGGPVKKGVATWVGEHGKKELFVPPENGTIVPLDKIKPYTGQMSREADTRTPFTGRGRGSMNELVREVVSRISLQAPNVTVQPAAVQQKIVNIYDSEGITGVMSSADGEQVILNVLSRNSNTVKQLLG